MRSLEHVAGTTMQLYATGLRIEGNPLPAPYPALIAPGQPAATRNVLAWLRGERDPSIAPPPPEETPPDLPPQGVGPHFAVTDTGAIGFAPPEALDREGNNIARLRSLHPALRDLANELVQALGDGNAPHPALLRRAEAYAALINLPLEAIDFARLFAAGVRLANAANAIETSIANGEDLPALRLEEREALDRWAPLVLLIPGISRWGADDRLGVAQVIRAKGGRRESDFVLRFDAHARLRSALRRLALQQDP